MPLPQVQDMIESNNKRKQEVLREISIIETRIATELEKVDKLYAELASIAESNADYEGRLIVAEEGRE